MTRKRSEPENMESSSGEEEEDEEEDDEEDETASESSTEEDEFDPADDRVNVIPGENAEETPSEAPKSFAQDESSSESDEEEDTMELDVKPLTVAPHPQENIRTFESDVESEYETGSSSESEGATQKPANDMVQGSPIEAVEASPPSQKKVQEACVLESKGTAEEDEVVKRGNYKAVKQQRKDPPPSSSAKGEVSKNVQEVSQSARKGHGGVIKEIASDDSVRDDNKLGTSFKKRKPEALQLDAERDSADSGLILKKRKDADVARSDKKSAGRDKVSQSPSITGNEDPFTIKKGVERDKLLDILSDAAKEVAKKTLNNSNAIANGSKDVLDSKVSTVEHESRQGKKAKTSASKQKKLPHVWSVDEEIVLALEVLNRVKMGLEVPSKRNDDFWLTLSEILQEKAGIEFSRDQLSEKFRRMKQKYKGTVEKIEEFRDSKKPYKHKNVGEQRLFDILSQVWERAEVISLEDQRGADQGTRKDPSKLIQSPDREGKGRNVSSPKAKSSTKANGGKDEVVAMPSNDVSAKIAATSSKVDQEKFVLHTLAQGLAFPASHVDSLLEDKIQATLHELQEWSKQKLEEWMNKAYLTIEDSTKRLENQVKRTSWMGMAGGALPMRSCDAMDFLLVQGDKAYQQQWHELQVQEMNVYVQRLELMRRECELKQEQLKLQLQEVQGQKQHPV